MRDEFQKSVNVIFTINPMITGAMIRLCLQKSALLELGQVLFDIC